MTQTYRNLGAGARAVPMAGCHRHVDTGAGCLTAAVAGGRPTGAGGCGREAHLVGVPLMEQRHVVRQEAGVQGLGRGWCLVHPAVRRPVTGPGSEGRYLGCPSVHRPLSLKFSLSCCYTTITGFIVEKVI
jgi:hypothetical protein